MKAAALCFASDYEAAYAKDFSASNAATQAFDDAFLFLHDFCEDGHGLTNEQAQALYQKLDHVCKLNGIACEAQSEADSVAIRFVKLIQKQREEMKPGATVTNPVHDLVTDTADFYLAQSVKAVEGFLGTTTQRENPQYASAYLQACAVLHAVETVAQAIRQVNGSTTEKPMNVQTEHVIYTVNVENGDVSVAHQIEKV
nr:hypothetical protein [uncultured Rhodoferax sp.]